MAQAVLEPFCAALAATKRPALAARLADGVFGELQQQQKEGGSASALQNLDAQALAARLFELGTHALCCMACMKHAPKATVASWLVAPGRSLQCWTVMSKGGCGCLFRLVDRDARAQPRAALCAQQGL